jgi:hypothetical protein
VEALGFSIGLQPNVHDNVVNVRPARRQAKRAHEQSEAAGPRRVISAPQKTPSTKKMPTTAKNYLIDLTERTFSKKCKQFI